MPGSVRMRSRTTAAWRSSRAVPCAAPGRSRVDVVKAPGRSLQPRRPRKARETPEAPVLARVRIAVAPGRANGVRTHDGRPGARVKRPDRVEECEAVRRAHKPFDPAAGPAVAPARGLLEHRRPESDHCGVGRDGGLEKRERAVEHHVVGVPEDDVRGFHTRQSEVARRAERQALGRAEVPMRQVASAMQPPTRCRPRRPAAAVCSVRARFEGLGSAAPRHSHPRRG